MVLDYSLLKRFDTGRVLMSVVHVEQNAIFVCRKTDSSESISVEVYRILEDVLGNHYVVGQQSTKIYNIKQPWNGVNADEALTIVALRSLIPQLVTLAGYTKFEDRVMEVITQPNADVPVILYTSSTNQYAKV